MRILHYTLGFPPYRSGGLVKYVMDLMGIQSDQGYQVFSLYPGSINFFRKKTYIEKKKDGYYEIVNSLPLAIFGGIRNPEDFMTAVSVDVYIDFLDKLSLDLIHVHTLMGIHKEFFQAAKLLNIPVVFTSHDYYGLSPVPSFFANGISYDEENSTEAWRLMSLNALSTNKLRVFQFRFFPFLKKINHLKQIKKRIISKKNIEVNKNVNYINIKNYYQSIFQMVDLFFFNSTIAKDVYLKNLGENINYKVIPITTKDIYYHSLKKNLSEKIRIAYIGPNDEFKGFYDFIELSRKMNHKKYSFITYGYEPNEPVENVNQRGKYSYNELDNVYKEIDVLVVPSKWKETFGLIVLEALSRDVKVIVSNLVGAKDLLNKKNIYEDILEIPNIVKNYSYDNNELILLIDHQKILNDYYSKVVTHHG